MRKILIILFLSLLCFSGYSDLFLSGDFSASMRFLFPTEEENYTSVLNPGNVLGIKDFLFSNEFNIYLGSGDEITQIDVAVGLTRYPVGEGLLAASYDDNDMTQMYTENYIQDFIAFAGASILTFDILRANVTWYISDVVKIQVGRQNMLSGYGYGWNPMDFSGALKDPNNPNADIKGVDAFSLLLFPYNLSNLRIYALLSENAAITGIDYEDLMAGAELTISVSSFELKVNGIFDYDDIASEDAFSSGIGCGMLMDILGAGIYGELACLSESRNYTVADDLSGWSRQTDFVINGLAGIEYIFPAEINFIIEYFYNGEGYNEKERRNYNDILAMPVGPTAELYKMFRPGYFAEHYILANLAVPLYDLNADISLAAILSPDSGALSVNCISSFYASGNLTLQIIYSGMFDIYNTDYNEAAVSPLNQLLNIEAKYSF